MSKLARDRATAAVVASLFAASPLLLPVAGYAAPAQSGKEVVFRGDGGLLGLGCGADPSVTTVTVPAETILRVRNETGRSARLSLDGMERGQISDGRAAQVLFHSGPVSLALKPDCAISSEGVVRVDVVPGPGPTAPAVSGGGTSPSIDGEPGSSSPGPNGQRPATGSPGAGVPVAGNATGGGGPQAGPAHSNALPGGAVAGEGGIGSGAVVVDGVAADSAAAEPLDSVTPVSDSGPSGLLAAVATVCVVGVSIAAIRAIAAQRAYRTGLV